MNDYSLMDYMMKSYAEELDDIILITQSQNQVKNEV